VLFGGVMNESSLDPRPVSASVTTMTEFVLPTHANALGSVFGGQIMAWMDLCGAICAQRHTGRVVITAGVDELSFERPIKVGQVVRISARVTATFRTSLELHVVAEGEDAVKGETWGCVSAFLTFVAVDEGLKPALVRGIEMVTEGDRRYAAEANERRAHRLAKRRVVAG
jgi:acyl-CoA hydrolase